MRIQLDYYRILGLTPQATSEQINRAHRDRAQSLPRREYSDLAIASRKKLLGVAYSVLVDPSQRQIYDAQILPARASTEQNLTFSVEIEQRELSGALLVLYELGEYVQILQLTASSDHDLGQSFSPDVVLSIGLAYLELGRESWKQAKYEAAFQYFEAGKVLLVTESLFTDIRLEIEFNLWQLRPYRILELIAYPEDQISQRQQGISLLKEMLDERGGIEGQGDDRSGLDLDKFLQFILQIRTYMTSYEQQLLFEDEAKRPSLVASYLAVHALIARGFSQGQPALIRRGKSLLSKIGSDGDLEQAIYSMLLGQLAESVQILALTNEAEQLALIYEMSNGEPDLVPGLYVYTRQWLQVDIYPHFRDLVGETVDLQPYFANEHVQAYIEELPNSSPALFASPKIDLETEFMTEVSRVPQVEFERDFSIYPQVAREEIQSVQPVRGQPEARSPIAKRQTRREQARRKTPHSKVRTKVHNPKVIGRSLWLGMISLAIAAGAMALGFWLVRNYSGREQLVSLQQPLLPLVEAAIKNSNFADPVVPSGTIDQTKASDLVSTWQTIKTKALGNAYEIKELDQILAEPVLSDWRSRAENYKKNNEYLAYIPKSLEFKEFKQINENKAYAIAQIAETRNFYKNGQLDQTSSVEDSYQAKYILVKKDNKWLIEAMVVIK